MIGTPLPRIAVVVPGLTQGGGIPAVARFVTDVILRSNLYDLKLVSLSMSARDSESMRLMAPHSWLRGAIATTGTWEGLPFVQVGAIASEFEFQRYRPRRALTQTLANCDLIQMVCGSPAWANAVVGLGKPVAMHVATRARIERRRRDANGTTLSSDWRRAMTKITDRLDDRALRLVDAIQVMNPWMLDYARAMNAKRTVDLRYVPPGVDAKLFHPLEYRELGHDPYILCVGRFNDPRKNIGLLLEAYAQLPAALRKKVRLVLAGSSGPPDAFWRRADALDLRDRISYVDEPGQNALVRLYQEASVFALPSDEEGFGVVLLEAMACAIPVISTRSGGPDGIITDGDDGCLVGLDDTLGLTSRLAEMLLDPKLNIEMGRKGRQTIERRFDEHLIGEVFIDVWDRMMTKPKIA